MNDLESGQRTNRFKLFVQILPAFSDKSVRQDFIKKTYSFLTGQLLVTFILCFLFSHSEVYREFAKVHWLWLCIVAGIGSIMLFTSMACSKTLRTKEPINFILFGLITFCESFAVSYGSIIGIEPTMSMFITSGIIIGLAIFAMQTRVDFAFACNRFLFSILLLFVMTGISIALYPLLFANNLLMNDDDQRLMKDRDEGRGYIVGSAIGAFILSFIILMDTQLMFTEGRYRVILPEQPLFAALVIHFDICMAILLIYILTVYNTR